MNIEGFMIVDLSRFDGEITLRIFKTEHLECELLNSIHFQWVHIQ
jgi:hypothetical protein